MRGTPNAHRDRRRKGKTRLPAEPRPGVTGACFDAWERWLRLSIGVWALANDYSGERHAQAKDAVGVGSMSRGPEAGLPGSLLGAIAGLALAAHVTVLDRIAGLEVRAHRVLGRFGRATPVHGFARTADGFIATWNERFRAESEVEAKLAVEYLARVGPGVLDELLARIDVARLLDHVDVNGAVERVDLDALIDRVPMDRVIDSVDLRAVVLETISQVQVSDIVRESTGAMASRLTGGRLKLT